MSALTTHVLDTSLGRPASGRRRHARAARGGRLHRDRPRPHRRRRPLPELLPKGVPLQPAVYRLSFDSGAYFGARGVPAFYPEVSVVFEVREPAQHHHVPLLLSPFGYSTYRGS